jgi:hypothetical protein
VQQCQGILIAALHPGVARLAERDKEVYKLIAAARELE